MYAFVQIFLFVVVNSLSFSSFHNLRMLTERKQNFRCYSCNNDLRKYPPTLYNTTSGKIISVCNKCQNEKNIYILSWIDMNQIQKTNKIEIDD